jgi:NAD(P)-dependent dehydrogenase (short-subunit alcohol dehydrogenase family)
MIVVRGSRSRIAEELFELLPEGETVTTVSRNADIPLDGDRYLFCAGLLHGESLIQMAPSALLDTMLVNFAQVAKDCDRIIHANDRARICVIGSESGITGSFDGAYAGAKAALHRYVETKQLRTAGQQLVCIAPTIIEDAGMTIRRCDREYLAQRAAAHPKRRFLRSVEVARLVHHVLYVDEGYLSGVTIRMNGGGHT